MLHNRVSECVCVCVLRIRNIELQRDSYKLIND